ncbi:hypothetical protein AVEN_32365-1 [Araneus ventricosus]|uniref:Uncharacterized protein n=1 Tax=Araneus ventricosus TaxID=182803 RepID=A0A4Y2QMD5_ARAVE|nr:hypothetical protein AVEN_32365-1 [Araneus ventricosus]
MRMLNGMGEATRRPFRGVGWPLLRVILTLGLWAQNSAVKRGGCYAGVAVRRGFTVSLYYDDLIGHVQAKAIADEEEGEDEDGTQIKKAASNVRIFIKFVIMVIYVSA